jgi:tRNA(adenine34) deaminase
MSLTLDHAFMDVALQAANEALERGDLPIGAAIVIDDELVATGSNAIETSRDDTRHAEMQAIAQCAPLLFAAKRTAKVELFTTMEPCAMCFGAIAHFRIDRVVSALDDCHAGAVDLLNDHPYYGNRGTEWVRGFRADEALDLMRRYVRQTGVRMHLLEKFELAV